LPDRATRLRRRRLALLVAVLLVSVVCVLAVRAVGQLAGVDGSSRPEPVDAGPVPAAGEVYVVQPGDTLWTIATEVAPDRDPRPVVDALRSANGGSATLQVGARLEVDID
jgi:Tfp pilus assembly protein FimV